MVKSTNNKYILTIGIPIIIIAGLWTVFLRDNLILAIIILAACLFMLWLLYKKTRCLPYPLEDYGELTPVKINLPIDYQMDIYFSSLMAVGHSHRIAEFISPYDFKIKHPFIALNPILYNTLGEDFFIAAIVREIEKYRSGYQIKVITRLLLPVFSVFILLLLTLLIDPKVNTYFLQFIMPFILMILFVIHLFLWNRSVLKKEYQLDLLLTTYFSKRDVKNYICAVEKLEREDQKEKYNSINEHFVSERIKNLE